MSGVGEASLVLGIISSIIAIIDATKKVYDAANDVNGLPKAFRNVAAKLPIVLIILREAAEYIEKSDVDQETRDVFQEVLNRCERSASKLRGMFEKVIPKEGASRFDKYFTAAKSLGNGSRVEDLVKDILKEINLLSACFSFATQRRLESALEEVSMIEPSLPDGFTAKLPNKIKSGPDRIKLQEIRYQTPSNGQQEQDPKAILGKWMLPDTHSPDSVSEHSIYLQKRFRSPETPYTTCDWVFKTSQYTKFIDPGTSSVLRLKGPLGCGKSVLTASIIHQIQSPRPGEKTPRVLYCYARRDFGQTSSNTLIRLLLWQILEEATPDMLVEIKKIHGKHETSNKRDASLEEDLWELLANVLAIADEKVIIVVDGFDDIAQPLLCARLLIKAVTTLADSCRCSLLLSSRLDRLDVFGNKTIRLALKRANVESLQLEMSHESIRQDLAAYVSYQVKNGPSFLSTSEIIQDRIIAAVCERSNGMFLYANLVLDDLKDAAISSLADIQTTLQNLPQDLVNSYQNNFQNLRQTRRGLETIRWILCSNQALSWNELKSALAIGVSRYMEDELILDGCEAFVEHSCGQMVESFGPCEHMRFVHPTVKDFLIDSKEFGDGIDISRAHAMVAGKLLVFLDYPDLPSFFSSDVESPESVIKVYSARPGRALYSFATFSWYKHLRESDKSENVHLEKQVIGFLKSPSFVRWLKSATIMSRVSEDGRDSVSLTADVIDSLQEFVLGRVWAFDDSETMIQTWIGHFLDLMLDWGTVIETQPDWIHYLHQQFLSEASYFRSLLEDDGDQSIVQFCAEPIFTKHSERITWPSRCFAIDVTKDLAFTYDEPYISCYHIKTGLLAAEIAISAPPNVQGALEVKRGALSPCGKYLAVAFEAMGPSNDPVGSQIRAGRRLLLNTSDTGFQWGMDHALVRIELSGLLAHMAIGVDHAEFVVCLLELRHTGLARTHLFGLPSWAPSPILSTGTATMRWDLDDVDVLQFSADSSQLATSFGIFELETGKVTKPWSFALNHFYQGGKLTNDFSLFGTVLRDIEGDCIVQLYDMDNKPQYREIRFPGVVHILAISNHGRFLLLTRRDIVEQNKRTKAGKTNRPVQQGTIGVWDCRDGEWTPLLVLDQDFTDKLPQWSLQTFAYSPTFGPEAEGENELNRVFLYVPSRWKLASSVRKVKSLDPGQDHLLLFECKRSAKGFGKNPSLKLDLLAAAFTNSTKVPHEQTLTWLLWEASLDTATVYDNLVVRPMAHEQLRQSTFAAVNFQKILTELSAGDPSTELQSYTAFIGTANNSALFYVTIVQTFSMETDSTISQSDQNVTKTGKFQRVLHYDVSIACLLAGEIKSVSSSFRHIPAASVLQRSLELQYLCISSERFLSVGSLEFEIQHEYEDMSIVPAEPQDNVFDQAVNKFRSRAHPLSYTKPETSIAAVVEKQYRSSYAIFNESDAHTNPSLSEDGTSAHFVVIGETSAQDDYHVFQASKRIIKRASKDSEREANQFEVFLFVFDAGSNEIPWMIHTTTGGDISKSRAAIPGTSWALHPSLPLLVWLLPGHRLRVSNFESSDPPITLAESLNVEVESTQAIKFSPNGRYLMVQGREAFRNDFLSHRNSGNFWSVVICDLVKGTTVGATLASSSNITLDVDDNFLHAYRLTRDGAVESSTYTLPELVLSERQYLTFIPAHCCCSTCGRPYGSDCWVTVIEHVEVKSAVLGHSPLNIGNAPIKPKGCQPVIIRITTPPVELVVKSSREAVFGRVSSRLFPKIVDEEHQILPDTFSRSQGICEKRPDAECSCELCEAEATHKNDSVTFTRIPQVQTKIRNFKLPSGLAIPPDQVEKLNRISENEGVREMSILKDSDVAERNNLDGIKKILGEEAFPWDNWTEFKETMDEIKDVYDHEAYMKKMFEPGNCGVGCQIPLFIHTFLFDAEDSKNFHWSSASAKGWLEEDLEWYYERFFGGSFEGARRWYEFPAYEALIRKYDGLKDEKTEKGKRFRKYWGPKKDKDGKVLEIELPEVGKKDTFVRDGIEWSDEEKPMVTALIVKDVFESMSDLVPGLGKVFEQRLHTMLNKSLIQELVE